MMRWTVVPAICPTKAAISALPLRETMAARARRAGDRGAGERVIARINPETGDVESLDVLFFSTPLLGSELFMLPIVAHLRRADYPPVAVVSAAWLEVPRPV